MRHFVLFSFLFLTFGAVATQAQNPGALLQSGFAKYEQKDFVGAIKDFASLIENEKAATPPSIPYINALLYTGISYFELKKYNQAESFLKKVAEIDGKEYVRAYDYLGRCSYETNKFKDAITYLTTAISVEPKDQVAYYWRGLSFEKMGSLTKACEDLRVSQSLGNPNAESHMKSTCK